MKYIRNGDITTVTSGIIVHCCNAQGQMGAGVARALRDKWPEVFHVYAKAYADGGNRLVLGNVHYAEVGNTPEPKIVVANLIGQQFYGGAPGVVYVNYDAIRTGFRNIASIAKHHAECGGPLAMIHYPMLGAGLAGGDWTIIEKIINEEVEGLDHTLWVFE